jgi:RNA polymerase sigma-70 factor (ECF subfamily)
MPDAIDRGLLERFVQGDQDAFETLFRQFETEVYRWTRRILQDTSAAEDVVVETFWRVYRGRARFDPSRSFGAWIRRIATNVALDHLKASRPLTHSHTTADEIPAPAGPDHELSETVALAFHRLAPKLQVVARLALIEEWPYADIADALDLPVGTIKSRVFRATRALRKELTRQGVQP